MSKAFNPWGRVGGGGGEGGDGWATQQRLIRGGSIPRSNPLPFCILFLREEVSLLYTLYRQINGTPFTYLI